MRPCNYSAGPQNFIEVYCYWTGGIITGTCTTCFSLHMNFTWLTTCHSTCPTLNNACPQSPAHVCLRLRVNIDIDAICDSHSNAVAPVFRREASPTCSLRRRCVREGDSSESGWSLAQRRMFSRREHEASVSLHLLPMPHVAHASLLISAGTSEFFIPDAARQPGDSHLKSCSKSPAAIRKRVKER